MKKIRIAQIGVCHEHASGKINTLKRLPEYFEIAGVVDDNSFSRTPKLAGGDLTPYAGLKFLSLEEVLNDPTIEAVTVEVPNNELVPMAIRCMERNLPMHLDKPAGEDPVLYRKLLDGCRERNLPLQMGFMFRGNPAFRFCIEAIRSRLIGEVFEIEADMNHCYGGEEYQEYIGKFSGGIMYNLGCHLIDFVAAAMGRPGFDSEQLHGGARVSACDRDAPLLQPDSGQYRKTADPNRRNRRRDRIQPGRTVRREAGRSYAAAGERRERFPCGNSHAALPAAGGPVRGAAHRTCEDDSRRDEESLFL